MHINLICAKVNSLLPSFIEGTLEEKEENFVLEHLKICVKCRYKYQKMKKLMSLFENDYTHPKTADDKEYEYFTQNLSAYCDNELPFEESVKFKKYIIKTPKAREKLRETYKLRELLKQSHQNLIKKFNHDFSKSIPKQLYKKPSTLFIPPRREFAAGLILIVLLFTILGLGTIVTKSFNKDLAGKISHFVKNEKIKHILHVR